MLPDRHQISPVPDSPPFQILLTNGSQDPSDTVMAATMTGFAEKKRKNPFIEFTRFQKNMKVESQETRIGFDPVNFMFAINVEWTMM
ncbi:342_t:CDS:2 [Paraglomus brasilianum]|uniref:342_t:CDS:1 n=1 Tax=Paraglomus brasilianum TaxID=144538 RepID=A0A9N9B0C2_9GLOM|nr:342_t:CDS:2 [Paraglomus brasilianum]